MEAFPGLDVLDRGLVEVASREVDGLIVIDPLDVTDSLPLRRCAQQQSTMLADGPWRDKLLPAGQLLFVQSTVRALNWKVLVEQFLEGYHIRTTHQNTFYPLQYDDLNVVERFGPNSRITFPYRNIERLRNRPESMWTTAERLTYVYHLFPNVMFVTFPDVVLVVTIDPVDVGHSTATLYFLSSAEAAEKVAASRSNGSAGESSLLSRGGDEDNEMSEGVQRGLRAGANASLEFGTHESAIGHFHAALDERLAVMTDASGR
jgi:choline monooxygenase